MSTNPYADNDQQSPYAFQTQIPNPIDDGYVKQLPVIGTLVIVQACLELLMFMMMVAMSALMIGMQNSPQMQKVPNAPSMQFIGIGYAIFGALVGVTAILRLASGIMILRKKGRIYSIVVSIVGLASVFTCYCAPTSLALAIYSLVVLIQPSVIEQFKRSRMETSAP